MKRLIPRDELARVRAPLERAWTLPPAAYTTAEIFDAECDLIFQRDWICVARIDQLRESGDFVCADLIDQPIVVARAADGELYAFSRVCLHRSMPVAEGAGNVTRFVCPYHNWTYELDGQLRSAPMMDGAEDFHVKKCRLPQLKVETWQGFVFVNADPECQPLASRLTQLASMIENYGFDELVVAHTVEFDSPWNWKILVENFMEAYHHIGTHRHTFEVAYPARDSLVEDNRGEPWVFLRMPGNDLAVADRHLPAFPALSQRQQRELLAICVFPTLLFGASSDLAAWYQLEPRAHDRMRLRIHLLLRPEVAAQLDEAGRAALGEGIKGIHMEDIAANEGPWQGLHAPLTGQGRLSLFEKGIWQLNQLWLGRMGLG